MDKHLSEFTNHGYNVDYILYSRKDAAEENGSDNLSNVGRNMTKALCSENPKNAVAQLFSKGNISGTTEVKDCKVDITANIADGIALGLKGTPFIVANNGERSNAGFNSAAAVLNNVGLRRLK